MNKLKLNLAHEAGEVLSKEDMKKILGGTTGNGSVTKQFFRCHCKPPAVGVWEGYYTNHDEAMASTVKWCSNQEGFCFGAS